MDHIPSGTRQRHRLRSPESAKRPGGGRRGDGDNFEFGGGIQLDEGTERVPGVADHPGQRLSVLTLRVDDHLEALGGVDQKEARQTAAAQTFQLH